MKQILSVILLIFFLLTASLTLASVDIGFTPPNQGVGPGSSIGNVLRNALTIAFVVGGLIVLFMLVIGAIQWLTSGGDKENIGHARARITHALIGLVILALAFLITVVVGKVVNINPLSPNNQIIPSLGDTPTPAPPTSSVPTLPSRIVNCNIPDKSTCETISECKWDGGCQPK